MGQRFLKTNQTSIALFEQSAIRTLPLQGRHDAFLSSQKAFQSKFLLAGPGNLQHRGKHTYGSFMGDYVLKKLFQLLVKKQTGKINVILLLYTLLLSS